MTRVELLAAQMDEVDGRLRARPEGLTDAEFFWEPVPGCWTGRAVAGPAGAVDDDRPRRHHGGEIGCLRDLYRVTAGGS